MNILVSTAYWPSQQYFLYVLRAGKVCIEVFENYQKQSYRNRTQILSANGPLDLSIPVKKEGLKVQTGNIAISYQEAWQIRHWRAITSAYKNSPYFDFFEHEIAGFYNQRYPSLIDYNTAQLNTLLKMLRVEKKISTTTDYKTIPDEQTRDLRQLIHPKTGLDADDFAAKILAKKYYQTFENKFGFQSNPSILDLLFNMGLGAVSYLTSDQ